MNHAIVNRFKVALRRFSIKSTKTDDKNEGQYAQPSRAEQPNSEANIMKRMLQNQHMQPAFLPEYYKSPIDLDVGTYPNPSSARMNYGLFSTRCPKPSDKQSGNEPDEEALAKPHRPGN